MYTLQAGKQHGAFIPIQNATRGKDQNGVGIADPGDPMYTLDSASQHAIAYRKSRRAQSVDDHETWVEDDVANTLNGFDVGDVRTTTAVAFSENQRAEVLTSPVVRSMTNGGGKPGQGYPAVMTHMAVRRLTPRECLRLQSFPDDWLDLEPPLSDSAKYRMVGNSVTVNVAAWLGRRIVDSA